MSWCHHFVASLIKLSKSEQLQSHEGLVDIRGLQSLNLRRDVPIHCADWYAALTPDAHAIAVP